MDDMSSMLVVIAGQILCRPDLIYSWVEEQYPENEYIFLIKIVKIGLQVFLTT